MRHDLRLREGDRDRPVLGLRAVERDVELRRGVNVVEQAVAVQKVHGAAGGNDDDARNERASVLIDLDLWRLAPAPVAAAGGFSSHTTAFRSSCCGDTRRSPASFSLPHTYWSIVTSTFFCGGTGASTDHLALDRRRLADTRRARERQEERAERAGSSRSSHPAEGSIAWHRGQDGARLRWRDGQARCRVRDSASGEASVRIPAPKARRPTDAKISYPWGRQAYSAFPRGRDHAMEDDESFTWGR